MIKGENFLINPIRSSESLSDMKTSLEMAGYQEINRTSLTMGFGFKERSMGFILSLIDKISSCYDHSTTMGKMLILPRSFHDVTSCYLPGREIKIVYERNKFNKIYHCSSIRIIKSKNDLLLTINDTNFYKSGYGFNISAKSLEQFQEGFSKRKYLRPDEEWNLTCANELKRLVIKTTKFRDTHFNKKTNISIFDMIDIISWIIAIIQDRLFPDDYRVLGVYVLPCTKETFEHLTGLKYSELRSDY